MTGLDVIYEKNCGRYGKIRVTEGTVTVGTRTFPKNVIVDFEVRRPGLLSLDALVAFLVVACTLTWILVFLVGVVYANPQGADGGQRHGTGFMILGSLATVFALCLSGHMIRRFRTLYRFRVRTSSGTRFATRFYGPDPELESVFEQILAGRA